MHSFEHVRFAPGTTRDSRFCGRKQRYGLPMVYLHDTSRRVDTEKTWRIDGVE
jgi:hypothetical protein